MSGMNDNEFGLSFEDDWSGDSDITGESVESAGRPERTSIPTEDELEMRRQVTKQESLAVNQGQRQVNQGQRQVNQGQNNQRTTGAAPVQRQQMNPNGQNRQNVQRQQNSQNRPNIQNGQPGQMRQSGQSGQRQNQNVNRQSGIKVNQVASKVSSKVDEVTDRASEFTKDYSERIKEEYKADMSTDMKAKGTFGWSLYLYAILAFGFFMFESSTALLLVAGWVILTEKNTKVNKMIISTIILYVTMKLGWSVFNGCYSLVYDLIPREIFKLDVSVVKDTLSTIKKFINNIYDFAYIVVGLRGLLLAKKGSYFKLRFVEGLFE